MHYQRLNYNKKTFIWSLLFLFFQSKSFAQMTLFAELTGNPVNTAGWNLEGDTYIGDTAGDADTDNDEIILTQNIGSTSGAVFYNAPIDFSTGGKFIVDFDFRMWEGSAADGIAFCLIENLPTGYLGAGGIGVPNPSVGLKVLFDTYDNCGGPNPEIQIFNGLSYDECAAGIIKVDNSLGNLSFIRSNNYNSARITYENGVINVFINCNLYLTANLPISNIGYFGFTAATGGSTDLHSLKNVKIYTYLPNDLNAEKEVCSEDQIQIGVNPDPEITYLWSPAVGLDNVNSSNPTFSMTNNTNNAVVYTYVVRTHLTSDACPYYVYDTVKVNVFPRPTAAFNATNSCDNQLVNFNSTSTIGVGAITQTLWDMTSDGLTDYITTNGAHLYPSDGLYNVTLITVSDQGCRDTFTQSVTVYPLPVSSFTHTNSCDEQAVTFNSTSTILSGSISQTIWDIDTDGTTDYTTLNGSHIYPTDGNYNITLIAVSNNGCRDTISQIATVYPLPVAEFNFQNACHLNPVTFNSTSTILSGTIDQYFWDVQNDNIDDYFTSNGNHIYPSEGNYNIRHIVETDHGCRDTITKSIIVEPKPTAQFSFMNACDGDSLLFVSQASVAYGTINQTLWDIGSDGNIDYTTTNGGHLFPVYGRYDITQIVVTSGGCSDTLEQEVLIYPLPIASWTSSSVCEGNQMTFNNLSSVTNLDNDLVTQWEWAFGDGSSSLQQNPLHLYNDEQIYNTQLVVTTNHGCKDTFINSVTIWPLPQVNFSPTDVCLDNLTNFQDLSSISNVHTTNSTIQWDWDFGDLAGGTSSVQNPSYTYSQDGTFNAKLVVTSNHNCKDSTTLNVTVHPKPVANFTGVNLAGCTPICPVISSTSTVNNPSSIVNYTWKLSDGTTYNSTSPDYNICLENQSLTTNNYDVELIVETNKGCVDTHKVLNFISVYHLPIASFYADPAELNSYQETTTFMNESQGADNYSWNFGDGNINTNTHSPSHSYPHEYAGVYNVTLVTSTNEGCIDSTHLVIKLKEEQIFYIPNAFTPDGNMHNQTFKPVLTNGFDLYNYKLTIYNRWGEAIFESNDIAVGWDGTYGNDAINHCETGTYIWKIEVKTIDIDERQIFTGHVNLLK